MREKKKLYILLPLVALVWGVIGFRVYEYYTANQPETETEIMINKTPLKSGSDSFSLFNDYPDPFLGEVLRVSLPGSRSGSHKKVALPIVKLPVKAPEVIRWPVVQYKGTIKSEKNGKVYAVVTINNRERLVKEKDLVDGLAVFSIRKDSIGLDMKGERRFFRK